MRQTATLEHEFTAKNLTLFIVACCCACLCGINVSSIAAVFPDIKADLGTDLVMTSWIMSIYSLITYPSMIMIGRIGDLIGHKQAVIASCAMFAIGSVGAALAPSVWMIIVFRAVQAIGGGGLPTSCMSLVAVLFPKNRHKMMGFAVNVFPLAQIIGSNFGVLVTNLTGSWRGVFWVNAVVMVIAIIMFALYMPKSRRDEDVSIRQIDFLGALLMCGSVCFLMLAITKFKDITKGVDSGLLFQIILFFAIFLVLAALFVLRVRTARHPIVDRKVLFNKKFSSVTIFFFIYGFVALGMAQMIPTFAQSVYGFSDGWAAAVVLVKGIGWFLVGLIIAGLIKKLGYRIPLLLIIAIIALSYLIIGLMSRPTSFVPETIRDYLTHYLWLFIVAFVLGAGSGCASPTMTNCAVDLMPENVGTIYGVTAAFRQIGSTLCVPIVTVIVAVFGDNYAGGFRVVYIVMTVMMLLCLPFVFMMPKAPRADHVAPRRH